MFTLTAAIAVFDEGVIWERIEADVEKHTAAKHERKLSGLTPRPDAGESAS